MVSSPVERWKRRVRKRGGLKKCVGDTIVELRQDNPTTNEEDIEDLKSQAIRDCIKKCAG
jgi:hypothetical protein